MGTIPQLLKAQKACAHSANIAADEWPSPSRRIGLALCHTRDDKIHG
jgi:hypothetical protein